MKQAVAPGAWNAEKVDAFKDAFLRFLNYVTIDSKETGPTTLGKTVYEAQRRALECIFAGLANDVHDFKILKSRQLGISTITEALDVFWLGMHEGCQGALIFDTSAHLEKARERIVNLINLLPAKLKFPKIVSNNRYSLTLSNRSTVAFMAAGTRSSRGGGSLGASIGLNFIHACMAPETPVLVDNGHIVALDKVVPGMKVLTHTGAETTVLANTGKPNPEGTMLRLTPWLGDPVLLTKEHKVPTGRGLVMAGELRAGDVLLMPIRKITKAVESFTMAIFL